MNCVEAAAKFLIYNDKVIYQYKGNIYMMSIVYK